MRRASKPRAGKSYECNALDLDAESLPLRMTRYPTLTAVLVLLERDGKYFFIRRANTGWNDGRLTLPSGHVDKGETVKQAAVKEVKEESGVGVDESDLEFLHVQYIFDAYIYFFFKTTKWEGEPHNAEPHLCSEVLWKPKDDIPNDVIMHVRQMFDEVAKGNYFSDVEDDPGGKS